VRGRLQDRHGSPKTRAVSVLQEGAGGGNAFARSLRRKENVRWWLWIKDILRSCGFHKVSGDKWGLSRFILVNKMVSSHLVLYRWVNRDQKEYRRNLNKRVNT
jgi:hypothetical protein